MTIADHRAVGFTAFAGHCWRAVPAGREAEVLAGTVRAGRYNRDGERTLYMSASPEGVAAAMARYGEAPRALVRLAVSAQGLVDLRDPAACSAFGVDAGKAGEDWLGALQAGETPPSWIVADRLRSIGANGLIDASRRLPGAWHLVLFRWNTAGGVQLRPAPSVSAPGDG